MFRNGKLVCTLTMIMLILLFFTSVVYGNSAEPPSILIIVPNAPEELEIIIGSGSSYASANVTVKGNEKYFAFYSHELSMIRDYTVNVSTGTNEFEILLEKPVNYYNNIYTLDVESQTLEPGKSLSRSISLISMRVAFTLIIEAIVFYLFGFRQRKSWLAFLVINIISQGMLNISLNGLSPLASYLIFTLILGEILVFLFEIITFFVIVREHSSWRTFSFVMIANTLSLLVGGYLITVMPI